MYQATPQQDPSEEVIQLEANRVLYRQRIAVFLGDGVTGRPQIHISHESAVDKVLRPAEKMPIGIRGHRPCTATAILS